MDGLTIFFDMNIYANRNVYDLLTGSNSLIIYEDTYKYHEIK